MKAHADCQTTNNGTSTNSKSGGSKRKTPPPEDENEDTPIVSGPVSPLPLELITDGTIFGGSPCEGSMFSNDGTPLLDFDNFDFETGTYTGTEEGRLTAVTSTSLDLTSFTGGMLNGQLDSEEDPKNTGRDIRYDEFAHTPNIDIPNTVGVPAGGMDITSTAPQLSTLGSADDVRKRLSELHSFLFTQLHWVTDANLAEAIFSPQNASLPSSDAPGPGANIIHRVIYASERLLELLAILRVTWNSSREHDNTRAFNASSATNHTPSRFIKRSQSVSRSLLSQHLQPLAESNSSVKGTIAEPMTSSASPSLVDLPTITSFLTCHVAVLSIYRTIFTHIYDALRACVPSGPTPTHVKPGPGGFSSRLSLSSSTPSSSSNRSGFLAQTEKPSFSSRHVLGLRIQLEVMTHMLDRMEDAWAAVVTDEHDREQQRDYQSLFGREATLVLLQSMLVQEGYECMDEGYGSGLGALTVMVNSIRRLLRSSGSA